jgi:hypothetical protein
VSIDEPYVAMPQLYGAPAYARPPAAAAGGIRPFDPDELPLEVQRTDEEQEFVSALPARVYAPGGVILGWNGNDPGADDSGFRPRSLSLRRIAGKLRRGN